MQSWNISVGSTDYIHRIQTKIIPSVLLSIFIVVLRRVLFLICGEIGFIYKAAVYREFISKLEKLIRPRVLEEF